MPSTGYRGTAGATFTAGVTIIRGSAHRGSPGGTKSAETCGRAAARSGDLHRARVATQADCDRPKNHCVATALALSLRSATIATLTECRFPGPEPLHDALAPTLCPVVA